MKDTVKDFLNKPIPRGKAMLMISCFMTIVFALLDLAFSYKFGVFVCTANEFKGVMIIEGLILLYCWTNYILFRNERQKTKT